MSLENRYKFLKKMHPNILILIKQKDKYISKEVDNMIFSYLNNDLNTIKKNKISYILMENLDIIEKNLIKNNEYYKYKKIVFISQVLSSALK